MSAQVLHYLERELDCRCRYYRGQRLENTFLAVEAIDCLVLHQFVDLNQPTVAVRQDAARVLDGFVESGDIVRLGPGPETPVDQQFWDGFDCYTFSSAPHTIGRRRNVTIVMAKALENNAIKSESIAPGTTVTCLCDFVSEDPSELSYLQGEFLVIRRDSNGRKVARNLDGIEGYVRLGHIELYNTPVPADDDLRTSGAVQLPTSPPDRPGEAPDHAPLGPTMPARRPDDKIAAAMAAMKDASEEGDGCDDDKEGAIVVPGSEVKVTILDEKAGSIRKHTLYKVHYEGKSVARRFKDLQWLHARLREASPYRSVPTLPESQFLGRFDARVLALRCHALCTFLQHCVDHVVLRDNPALKAFLTATSGEAMYASIPGGHCVLECAPGLAAQMYAQAIPEEADAHIETIRASATTTVALLDAALELVEIHEKNQIDFSAEIGAFSNAITATQPISSPIASKIKEWSPLASATSGAHGALVSTFAVEGLTKLAALRAVCDGFVLAVQSRDALASNLKDAGEKLLVARGKATKSASAKNRDTVSKLEAHEENLKNELVLATFCVLRENTLFLNLHRKCVETVMEHCVVGGPPNLDTKLRDGWTNV